MVQELILSSVSKTNPNNRFLVGDIKQSIYKFRKAKPELFMEKYNSFSEEFNGINLKIDLFKNFRSRATVLDSINFLFYQIMTPEVGEILYNNKQALYSGKTFTENIDNLNISNSTELHLIENKFLDTFSETEILEDLNKIELESKVIANRILELTSGKDKLFLDKKGEYKKANYKDIVILVRSISSVGETLLEELKNNNIPAFANTSTGFFNSLEVLTILSFLQIIDNPKQDIHLLTVLHSPVYCFTSQELLQIKNINPNGSLYFSILKFLEANSNREIISKLEIFLQDLNYWQKISTFTPINELIWDVYNKTNYFEYVGVMIGGLIRQGNLRTLQEKAIDYEKTSYKSLFHFIKYIERLQTTEQDTGNAKILSENENVVRIMTIHKSKGLEFPITFVSMLGRNFNLIDERKSITLHSEFGFGPSYIDIENRIQSNSLPRLALSKQIHLENLSEELRILYVALTRAEEKLILTGTVNDINQNLDKWTNFIEYEKKELPFIYMLNSNTFLDFIVPPIMRHKNSKFLTENLYDYNYKNQELYNYNTNFEIFIHHKENVSEEIKIYENKSSKLLEKLKNFSNDLDFSKQKNLINEKLNWSYKYNLENFPTNINISEIKRNFYSEEVKDNVNILEEELIFNTPVFLSDTKKITSIQKGTINHTVIEHLDFFKHKTFNDVSNLIIDLINRNILSEEEGKNVYVKSIVDFVNSKTCDRIRNSKNIIRERPFLMGLTKSELENINNNNFIRNKSVDEEITLVRGIIDCYFEEGENIILIDYKTDFVTEEIKKDIVEKYIIQMNIYAKVLEKSTNKKVSEKIIYLLGINEAINIDNFLNI